MSWLAAIPGILGTNPEVAIPRRFPTANIFEGNPTPVHGASCKTMSITVAPSGPDGIYDSFVSGSPMHGRSSLCRNAHVG